MEDHVSKPDVKILDISEFHKAFFLKPEYNLKSELSGLLLFICK